MSSIQFVMPSKGACKLPICSYVIVTMGGTAVLGLNYLLIAVVEIKPLASRTQSVQPLRQAHLMTLEAAEIHMFSHVRRPAPECVGDLLPSRCLVDRALIACTLESFAVRCKVFEMWLNMFIYSFCQPLGKHCQLV